MPDDNDQYVDDYKHLLDDHSARFHIFDDNDHYTVYVQHQFHCTNDRCDNRHVHVTPSQHVHRVHVHGARNVGTWDLCTNDNCTEQFHSWLIDDDIGPI